MYLFESSFVQALNKKGHDLPLQTTYPKDNNIYIFVYKDLTNVHIRPLDFISDIP